MEEDMASVAKELHGVAKPQREGELQDLLARVEAASGADRELDCLLHVTLERWKLTNVPPDYDGKNECEVWTPDGKLIEGFAYPNRGKVSPFYHVPGHSADKVHYTSRYEDAMRLCRLHAPAWVGPIHVMDCGSAQVTFEARDPCERRTEQAFGETPALALIAALLKALIASTASPAAGMDRARDEQQIQPPTDPTHD